MSLKVNRNGNFQVGNTASGGSPASGTIEITENGVYDVTAFAEADVQTPVPSGKITITQNGDDIDVSNYATADVDVEQGIFVDEDYTVESGKLTSASVELDGEIVAIIPDGVTEIGNSAFMGNTLINKVVMPNSVVSIENGVYEYPNSPNNATAFGECLSLKEVVLSNNLNSIGDYAFYGCSSLTSIVIPDGVASIGDSTFYGCSSLTSITIPDGVTSIGDFAFEGCSSLTSITIPDGVTSIGGNAFDGCSSLTSIVIPDSVTSIGNGAFGGCDSLTDIYYTGTQAEWEQIPIGTGTIPQGVTMHYEYTPT